MWLNCLIIARVAIVVSVALAVFCTFTRKKKILKIDSLKYMLLGVAIASLALFVPVYSTFFDGSKTVLANFFLSMHYMFRLFILDVEFDFISGTIAGIGAYAAEYSTMISFLAVVGPILTFGFVLSFFRNASAFYKYSMHFFSKAYVFSELNERSIALAESLYEKHKKDKKAHILVFTDVFEKDDEEGFELLERAREIGAIWFKEDMLNIHFGFHCPSKELYFFVLGSDEVENINQSLSLIKKYEFKKSSRLYVLSTKPEAEAIISNAVRSLRERAKKENKESIIVRRVDEVQSLIFRNLYDNGFEQIFESAVEEDGIKKINAFVIGMGMRGTEMVKALSWFGQMDGYRLEINAFEKDENAKSKFTSLCPELMKFSGVFDVEGETQYLINIHGGIDVETVEFDEMFMKSCAPTYIFISLGDDERNVGVAMKLRMLCERIGCKAKIQTVVINSGKSEALKDMTNFSGKKYDIDFIGDNRSSYSEKVILGTDLEDKALARHLRYGDAASFWQYNYNYRSSVASAIHYKMKKLCNIPGVELTPDKRNETDKVNIRILEHRRWNAYVRSEGYVWGGSTDKALGRNDLAKKHNNLVPFWDLPPEVQAYDDD